MMASIEDLAAFIRKRHPSATVTMTRYPSGAATLDVVCDDRLCVLESRPGEGYGLSLDVPDEEGFLGGHDLCCTELTSAAAALLVHLGRRAPDAAVAPAAQPGPSECREGAPRSLRGRREGAKHEPRNAISRARMDKTALSVASLTDEPDDKAYWLSKTPQERMEALELLRQWNYGYDPETDRIQRVFEVVDFDGNVIVERTLVSGSLPPQD